jgi:acyl transferase domain-containing protein
MTDFVALLSKARSELEERRLEIERLRSSLREFGAERSRAIAVVGCSVRLPGGISTLEGLWEALIAGRVQGAPLTQHRFYEESDFWSRAGEYTGRLSCLEDPWGFDHRFFRMSPREVRQVDPQQRLLLELGWEALENAALPFAAPGLGTGGVFVGLSSDDYQRLGRAGGAAQELDAYAGTGTHRSMAAGRLAAFLGWTGPALQVDTACSSSLVAVHLACQALRNGDIDVALAGGCHLILDPASVVERGALGALAPDGLCKPFEAAANGFGMGEGAAMVALRRYDDAVREGEPIVGVIHGIAVNHNGAGAGITVPNPAAQSEVMRAALRDAGSAPADTVFVEAHGTGTRLGDPIEAGAIEKVYGPRSDPLPIGSLKANFGHLEAAAGIVSMLKALLIQRHGLIPPTPAGGPDSTIIPWGELSMRVPRQSRPLDRRNSSDRVSVSSFGMSGTNCHVVLGPPPAAPVTDSTVGEEPLPFLVSAVDEAALSALCGRLAEALRRGDLDLASVARTLAAGRAGLPYRAGFVATGRDQAVAVLDRLAQGEAPEQARTERVVAGAAPPIVWRAGTCASLAMDASTARRLRDRCAALCVVPKGALTAAPEDLARLDGPDDAVRLLSASLWGNLLATDAAALPAGISQSDEDGRWTLAGLRETSAELSELLGRAAATPAAEALTVDLDLAAIDDGPALRERFALALVSLFCRGAALNWANVAMLAGPRVALPSYPFQRRDHQVTRSALGDRQCC